MTENLSYRMLFIEGLPTGLIGLEELFAELYDESLTPESDDLDARLVRGVKKHNFIPKPAIPSYMQVITDEFSRYYTARSGGKAVVARDYGTWQGHPRQSIPWFPTVAPDLCNGCGKCIELCPKEVFAVQLGGKVLVVEPFLCVVGCCFCKSVCDPKAIMFPTQDLLNNYRPKA